MEKSNKIGILCTTTPKALTTLTILVTPPIAVTQLSTHTHKQYTNTLRINNMYLNKLLSLTHYHDSLSHHSITHSLKLNQSLNHSLIQVTVHSHTHTNVRTYVPKHFMTEGAMSWLPKEFLHESMPLLLNH